MKCKPLFSIISVTYNSSKFIRDAIESVLSSTFQDFEYIIGDDCSTDNTWEIIEEYKDPRIVRYRNEMNLREYPNRNKAISMSTGQWILFIDGDDCIFLNSLERLKVYIEKDYESISQICMIPYLNWARIPFIISGKQFFLTSTSVRSLNNIAFTNTVFRADLLKESFFKFQEYANGDQIIRLNMASFGQVLVIEDQLTWWRETPGQASARITQDLNTFIKYVNFLYYAMKDFHLSESEKRNFESNISRLVVIMIIHRIKRLHLSYLFKLCQLLKKHHFFSVLFLKIPKEYDFLPQFSPENPVKCAELVE
jgi:glycosyltransferase involved in cell wall biosynthesis